MCYHRHMLHDQFNSFAHKVSKFTGSPQAFVIAVVFIGTWIITGPIFGYSSTWQLVINTATTIVTFLMVFLIQNTQNRDTKAMHLKIDELIKANRSASNTLLNAEELSDEELDAKHAEFEKLHKRAEMEMRRRGKLK